jgi:hypothetical protein
MASMMARIRGILIFSKKVTRGSKRIAKSNAKHKGIIISCPM